MKDLPVSVFLKPKKTPELKLHDKVQHIDIPQLTMAPQRKSNQQQRPLDVLEL